MARALERNTLSGLRVKEAMRSQVISKPLDCSIANAVNVLIKYKVNALLVTDRRDRPVGVVSKTDIMNAYYAGLTIDSPLAHIMSAPPLYCSRDESLGEALERMRARGIYRLYVRDGRDGPVTGALAYPDIVGLLYHYCHRCEYSQRRQRENGFQPEAIRRYRVSEVMTTGVKSLPQNATLINVMEELSIYRFGALLITDTDGRPYGVISKTDLVIAYKHNREPGGAAATVMNSPVRSCSDTDLLEEAVRTMIFSDVQRLFVHRGQPSEIVGVLSLSDAARVQSGSCHACVSSRIKVEDHH